jgi:hypothetical protein
MSNKQNAHENQIQEFLKRIESKITEGARQLENVRLRTEIKHLLEPDFSVADKPGTEREFMMELTEQLCWSLKNSPPSGQLTAAADILTPLSAIRKIVSSAEFNEIVALCSKDVVTDIRLPLKEFLDALRIYRSSVDE